MKRLSLLFLSIFLATPRFAQANFTYADLKNLIATQKPQTVEELLEKLPPDYRQKSVLMLDSLSLQSAEPSLPRVLLFGNGDLVISFNGHAKQRGYEGIETLRYDWNAHAFTLEEIVFPKNLEERKFNVEARIKAQDPTLSPLEPIELADRSPREGANAPLCLQCHGKNPGPIVPRFPYGPGMLGGYTGSLDSGAQWFKDLQSSFASNPRFRTLIEAKGQLGNLNYQQSLNREFNLKLAERHWDQMAFRLMQKRTAFDQFKFALLAALNHCKDLEKFVAPALRASLGGSLENLKKSTFLAEKSAISQAVSRAAGLKLMPPLALESDEEISKQSELVARVRLVVEQGMKINMSDDFTMDGILESYDFMTAQGGIEQLGPHLIGLMLKSADPAASVDPNLSPSAAPYCERLLEKANDYWN